MYFFNDNCSDIKKGGIKEGGIVRNNAWIHFLRNNFADVKFIDFKIGNKILKYFNYLYFYLKCHTIKNDKVFFLYPKVGIPILCPGKKGVLFRKMFFSCIESLNKHNNDVIFDISDIKYEQAIDLEMNNLDLQEVKEFERKLFTMNQKYVFASYSMSEYAKAMHNISEENADVCINGGYQSLKSSINIDFDPNDDIVRCVYAGTLNKGRKIEQMIDAFPADENVEMLLMGTYGEWIPEYLQKAGKVNIRYLGSHEEKDAKKIVSKCDIGLIPYDDTRLYYNIAYPTKLSFYITAGIPFLSTPVKEVELVLSKYNIGYSLKIEKWAEQISSFTKKDVCQKKAQVEKEMHNFYWDDIFSKCKFFNVANKTNEGEK